MTYHLVTHPLEDAIRAYALDRTDAALSVLDLALIREPLHVPVSDIAEKLGPDRYDVPVICLRTESGSGAIPAFTTLDQLLLWEPAGPKYVTLTGAKLIAMADGMPEIDEIQVNPAGAPRGIVPRIEFSRLLSLS